MKPAQTADRAGALAPITGMDLYHLRTHRELLAQGQVGNSCVLAIELDGRLDVGWLERRLAAVSAVTDELRWAPRRSLRHGPVWVVGEREAPLPRLRQWDGDLLAAATHILREPMNEQRPWLLYLLRGRDNDRLALRWFHPFSDALGAVRLLSWLGSEAPAPAAEERYTPIEQKYAELDRDARRRLARAYAQHGSGLGAKPIVSLRSAAKNKRAAGQQEAVRLRLTVDETRAFRRSLRRRSMMADTSVLLFAAVRMLDALLAARGLCPPRMVIPVPVSFDPKRGSRRMFGNHVSMLMLSVDREDIGSEARVVASVARQRRAIVRGKLDLAMLVALDMLRRAPDFAVDWIARRPFGGERSSTLLSNPGELAIDTFAGCRVVDALPSPVVLTSPGLMFVSSEHGGQLSLQVVFRQGFVGRSEVLALLPQLKRDLLG